MRRVSKRASGLIGAVAVLGATLPGAAVASTPPPTLSGAFLSALVGSVPAATVDIVADCDEGSGNSTISWSASGDSTALFGTAPYPGTFVETGSATVGPQTAPHYVNGIQHGYLVTVEAFFSIDSAVGQVIGSKRLTGVGSSDLGSCRDLDSFVIPDSSTVTGAFRRVVAQTMSYEALILTGDGAWLDSGAAATGLEYFAGTGMAEVASVQEYFSSGQSAVVAATGGRATGGGRVGDVTFGFTANRDKTGTKGRCAVVDVPSETTVKCTDVDSIGVIGNRATILGDALFGETPVRYRIDVTDLEESGAGADTWTIRLSNGYTTGGTLTEGNVQVHK